MRDPERLFNVTPALAAHIEQERGVRVHPATVGRLIRKMGWRFKKTLFATERDRADVQEARAAWRQWQTDCDISKLVFLDETGAKTDMIRRYGRAKGGARCFDDAPGGHWKTMTFIAGLRVDELTAPWCLEGAMTGDAFKTYLETRLAPTLKPGDIVIADNLSSHEAAGVRQIIEACGARMLYLPPYSPDLNPTRSASACAACRAGLCKTQSAASQSHGAFMGNALENHRQTPAPV